MSETIEYPYRYSWGTGECGPRRGQRCRILKSRNGFILSVVTVEFEDGARFTVARAALHRIVER